MTGITYTVSSKYIAATFFGLGEESNIDKWQPPLPWTLTAYLFQGRLVKLFFFFFFFSKMTGKDNPTISRVSHVH